MGLTESLDVVPLDGRLGSAAMEASSQVGGVTPDGIREGDRTALQALVERRGPAVMAFCTRVCGPKHAERASAEAFARFRAAVRDALDLSAVDPEALLRGATRHAAASMARTPTGPPPHGRLRSRGTQTCEHVPTMLAARANGALGEADLERLARHLDRCERCNALADIFRSAEAAYAEPAVDTLGTETQSILMAAMTAVPATAIGVAPEPLPGAPAAEPQDGAFGHLPDLDDEVPVEAPAPLAVLEVVPEAAALPVEPVDEPAVAEPEPEPEAAEPQGTVAFDAVAEDHADDTPQLAVEHVAEPGEALDAQALVAEPLPDAQPALAEHEVDLGETVEWDMVPVHLERRSYAEAATDVDAGADAIAAPLTDDAPRTGRAAGVLLKVVLPVLLVAAFAVAALALTGVIGGSDAPAPPVSRPAATAPRVQKPVLTPLPVTVAADAASTSAPATTESPESPASPELP